MYSQQQLDEIDRVIESELMAAGLDHVIYMDMGGNAISRHESGKTPIDTMAFAALAAGNFAAVDAMAKLVGEPEFSLLFHKGKDLSIHFSKITEETLLISMFNKKISLGLVRLKVAQVAEKINRILSGK